MERKSVSAFPPTNTPETPLVAEATEAYSSAVSWPAVFAGSFVTAALSLILLALGTGIGLSALSPWATAERSTSAVSYIAIIWLILVQIIAAGIGGYLAGRLRTKWVNVHSDEVHFRDTAHGFLVWAVSLVLTAAFLGSAATSMIGGSGPTAVFAATQAEDPRLDPNGYFVDMLFRSPQVPAETISVATRTEVARIFAHSLRQTDSSAADNDYLSDVVASRTGLSHDEAQKRVSDVLTQLRQSADSARKAVAHSLYWTFLALLVGAFCASVAATIGGKQRDHIATI